MRVAAIFAVILGLGVASGAAAQDVDPREAIRDTRAVSERLEREWDCIRDKQTALERVVRLMRESQAQMARTSAGTREHDDARAAIRSLRQRAVLLERQALECRTEPSEEAASGRPVQGVVVREAPRSASERAVAQRNPATRVFERDTVLQSNVKAVVGEQVDGRGTIDGSVVRAAIRGVTSNLSRCYGRMVDRGALSRGTIILAFTVHENGRVTGVRTEQNSFDNTTFARCVRAAGRRIRPSSGSEGGEATVSYTLQFPAR